MDKKQNNQTPNLTIKFQESANHINNSSEEFLFDFGTITPGPFDRLRDRRHRGIQPDALSPRNAKLFASALVERLKAFEAQFGPLTTL